MQLRRSIKQGRRLGISFVEYVSSIQWKRAKEMLSGSAIKIKYISGQVGLVGFTNPNYFGIWFKETTGVNPSQFRNQSQ